MGMQKHNKRYNSQSGLVYTTTPASAEGPLDAAGDIVEVDVRDLTNVTITAIQVEDNGTATLNIEGSNDGGASWALITGGGLTDASFPAGAGTGVNLGLSDARGMPLQFERVRARLEAVTGTGKYRMSVAGVQLDGYR
jgi:hypothetical protein